MTFQRLVTAPHECSMHSIRTPAPPVGDRRCVARTARRTTRDRDARPETFSRESRAEKLEESPEGRIDCVRCEVVPPPKPAQRARTTGGLVRRRVSALHTAPDHGEGAHPHSRTLQQLCVRGLRSWFRDPHDVMIEAPENNEISTRGFLWRSEAGVGEKCLKSTPQWAGSCKLGLARKSRP